MWDVLLLILLWPFGYHVSPPSSSVFGFNVQVPGGIKDLRRLLSGFLVAWRISGGDFWGALVTKLAIWALKKTQLSVS